MTCREVDGAFKLTRTVLFLEESPAAYYVSRRPYDFGFDTEAAYAQIGSWLDNCCSRHETKACKRRATPTRLPTRVIDVTGRSVDGKDAARLVEPGEKAEGLYVALSYCWGRGAQLTTTTATLHGKELYAIPYMVELG